MPASLVVIWAAPDVVDEKGFIIKCKNPTTGIFEEVGRTAADTLTFTHQNLPYKTSRTYKVCAYNDTEPEGPFTAEATGTTAAPPPLKAPTNLTVKPL